MSLISDALKRQEQLRVPRAGAAQREVAAAEPPEVAAARPPEVAAARPPEVVAARPPEVAAAQPPEVAAARPPEVAAARPPEASRVSAQPRRVSDATSRGNAAPNFDAPAAQPRATLRENPTRPKQPSNRQTVKPSNPFIERERAAARRPNHSVLLMPVLGLIMLLVLLFLRREFAPSTPQATVRKVVESEKWKVESAEDAAVISDLFPEEGTGNREQGIGNREQGIGNREQETGKREQGTGSGGEDKSDDAQITDHEPATSNSLSASVASAPPRENPSPSEPSKPLNSSEPSNRQTVKPSNPGAEAPPQQPATWPAFTLTGIAVGRERLAILNTGEMLLAGETAKCGVKVEKVNASTVVFAWGGETKTLRKGEHSDKPAD